MYFLGLMLIWGLVAGEVRTQQIQSLGDNQAPSAIQISQPLPPPTPSETQPPSQNAERRLSLEDFFMNNNQQTQVAQQSAQQSQVAQQPLLSQFQVQQSDPNSVTLVRDRQFPSQNGGVLSRLMMLRRMLRLRRWARRLSLIPRLVRLGVQSSSLRQAGSEPKPVILANNRVGRSYNDEPYDPRDYVFGNKGYFHNSTASSQENYNGREQPKQGTNTYSRDVDPYYDTVNDLPYDLYDTRDVKNSNYGMDDSSAENQNKYGDRYISNGNDNRQLQAYDVPKNPQQNLKNAQTQQSNYKNPSFSLKQNDMLSSLNYPKNNQHDSYQQNKQVYDTNNQQDSREINYQQNQKLQENTNQHNKAPETNAYQDSTAHNDQHQLQLLRQQQLQLLREQQLLQLLREQQLLLEKERQQQLQQGNLRQQQNQNHQSQIESEAPYQNYPSQTYNQNSQETSEKNGYEKPLIADSKNVGGSTRLGAGGNVIGVGVNVGIKPPGVDIAVTNAVSPVIKPLPAIVNPIFSKPVSVPAAVPLVPLGFLPKPMLNLNGRMFFGAEMGKGVKVGR